MFAVGKGDSFQSVTLQPVAVVTFELAYVRLFLDSSSRLFAGYYTAGRRPQCAADVTRYSLSR